MLYLCYVVRALINSLVCWFCTRALGFRLVMKNSVTHLLVVDRTSSVAYPTSRSERGAINLASRARFIRNVAENHCPPPPPPPTLFSLHSLPLDDIHTFAHIRCVCCCFCLSLCLSVSLSKRNIKKLIWNRMTASVLKQDLNTKRFKWRLFILTRTDTVCKFSGKSPLSSHKMSVCGLMKGISPKISVRLNLFMFGSCLSVCLSVSLCFSLARAQSRLETV